MSEQMVVDPQVVGGPLTRELAATAEVVGQERTRRTLSELPQSDRQEIIQFHRSWIQEVVQESARLATLTPRVEQEVLNILYGGFGDILFLEGQGVLTPVSILLLTETFTLLDQKSLYGKLLGSGFKTVFHYLRTYSFYESTLGYTDPDYRNQGYNSYLRRILYTQTQYKNVVIVGSTCNPLAMIMLAREGLVPVAHSDFPLATLLLSFVPYSRVFEGYKPVPPIEEVRWMTDEEVVRLRGLLAQKFEDRGRTKDISEFPSSPVVFVSMEDRVGFTRNPSAGEYETALPHSNIEELELTLMHAILMSPGYLQHYGRKGDQGQVEYLHKALYEISQELRASP